MGIILGRRFLPSNLILCSIAEKWLRPLCPGFLGKVELYMCSPNQKSLVPVYPMLDDLIQAESEQCGQSVIESQEVPELGTEHGVDLTAYEMKMRLQSQRKMKKLLWLTQYGSWTMLQSLSLSLFNRPNFVSEDRH